MKGRQSLVTPVSATAGIVQIFDLDPQAFGDRIASIGTNFVRFRIKSLRIQYKPLVNTNFGGMLTMGVQDDLGSTSSTTFPSTRDQVLNLRRAAENSLYRGVSLSWRPLDPQKWYYVAGGSSTGGDRFSVPACFYWIVTPDPAGEGEPPTLGFIDANYVVEFAGASISTLSVSSPVPSIRPSTPRPSQEETAGGYVKLVRPLMSARK